MRVKYFRRNGAYRAVSNHSTATAAQKWSQTIHEGMSMALFQSHFRGLQKA